MATRSNRVLARRALDCIKRQRLSSHDEDDDQDGVWDFLSEPDIHDAHNDFMIRLLRLEYKAIRATPDITCAYTMRDVIVCARSQTLLGKTELEEDCRQVVRAMDMRVGRGK